MSAPASLLKYLWGAMWIMTYRSPGYSAPAAISPSPESLSWYPASIPGGILTVTLRSLWAKPFPLHLGHGLSMILPLPPHVGHGMTRTNMPKAFLVVVCTLPAPLHLGQDG